MVETAATQTPEAIPEGALPEEFLRDADLPGFYDRQIVAKMAVDPHDPDLPGLVKARTQARIGSMILAAQIEEQAALAAVAAEE